MWHVCMYVDTNPALSLHKNTIRSKDNSTDKLVNLQFKELITLLPIVMATG